MATSTFDLPMMYGDHHVIEVRNLLAGMPGIETIYASSCFRVVEVTYDDDVVDEQAIAARLDDAGYGGDLVLPVEQGTGASESNGRTTFFRHTAVFEQVGHVVSFGQKAPYAGRPLWPCPGVGALTTEE